MFSEMSSVSSSSAQATNWPTCVSCQLDSKEPVISPNDTVHETIVINIIQFSDLDSMPVKIDLARLDSGNGIQ